MDEKYCPYCGHEREHELTAVEQEEHTLVEVERIRADKEITLARLASRAQDAELETAEHVAELQADADVVSAVAEAEVIAAGLEAGQEPPPDPTPVTVVQDDDDDQAELPPREEHTEPRAPRQPRSYFGF